ncbi:MAG TPA: response regulator [Gemmatimonadaceae bacterium]|nr:response regulator [Gemmatimonadaceae bacterium]
MMNVTNQPVLVVEDDDNDVLFVQRAFKHAGILNPLQIVRNGDDAVAYLEGSGTFSDREKYPLPVFMLLDLKMPRRSGLEVLQWVKERDGLRRIPIVVLTSSKNEKDVNRAYELGANSYLVKPVSFEGLIELTKSLHLYWLVLNERPSAER